MTAYVHQEYPKALYRALSEAPVIVNSEDEELNFLAADPDGITDDVVTAHAAEDVSGDTEDLLISENLVKRGPGRPRKE